VAKKLAIVLSVLLTGVGLAHSFRKDASPVRTSERTLETPAFREPVARRLIPAPPTRFAAPEEVPPAITSPFRIPLVETRAAPPAVESAQQPTFRHELPSANSMFRPQDLEQDADATVAAQPTTDPSVRQAHFVTHRIADGDTLSGIAAKYLGRADRYAEIFNTNRDVLRSPDLLPIGKVLKIPQPPAQSQPQPTDLILQSP